MSPDIIIGVDPGSAKNNGLASYDLRIKRYGDDCGQYAFFDLLNALLQYKGKNVLVRLEDTAAMQQLYARRMKPLYDLFSTLSTWTVYQAKGKLLSQVKTLIRISNNVGKNSGISMKIAEYCERIDLPLQLVVPSITSYTKLNPEEMLLLTGITEEEYPVLYKNISKVSWDHLRDALGLLVDEIPILSQFLFGMPQPDRKLTEYQERIKRAMAKGLLNKSLQQNKKRRARKRYS